MKEISARYSKEIIRKAENIRAIFCDVDGVLSDGKIIYDADGKELKAFNVKDGQIIKHLKKENIIVGIISGRESKSVSVRAVELKLDFCHQGILDKAATFEKLIKHYQLKAKEVAFIGDDINDLPVLRKVGLSVCPADTFEYIKQEVDLVTFAKGGKGVLREVADMILAAKGKMEKIIKS
ncbi:MAG TPA: HAD-IIIA family hydrolase [Cyclobacteriaceae bacterium]|nr:HAD-IIIA family hydrolase [Cyclobacteriaceae bacterium]